MKKKFMIFLIPALILLISCNEQYSSTKNTESDFNAIGINTADHKDTPFILTPPDSPYGLEENTGHDYSQITAEAEQVEYPADTEKINIKITDNTPGEGFYLYAYPGLEKKIDGQWEPVAMSGQTLQDALYDDGFLWGFVMRPDSEYVWTVSSIKRDYLYEPWTAGDYRAVIFLGDRKIYAEFKIVDS